SNAHAYRLLIIKEHRKTLIYSSFCAADLSAAKKRDSNLLFASPSNVFENSFLNIFQLACRLQNTWLRQQQRGEILICFFNFVKHFRKIS
ncbi:hypothetical protein, partial [Roseateles sp. LKC17W]